MKQRTWTRRCLGFALLIASWTAQADWLLDNATSQLSFVSVKATDVVEVHRFNQLSGTIYDSGKRTGDAELSVHLASVNTQIPLRDSRMRDLLFEIAKFPTAELFGSLELSDFTQLAIGDSMSTNVSLTLDLHGNQAPVEAVVLVSRLGADRIVVTSAQPVVVQAQTFGLLKGIDALREAAGLPSISKAIPVSFVLTFIQSV